MTTFFKRSALCFLRPLLVTQRSVSVVHHLQWLPVLVSCSGCFLRVMSTSIPPEVFGDMSFSGCVLVLEQDIMDPALMMLLGIEVPR